MKKQIFFKRVLGVLMALIMIVGLTCSSGEVKATESSEEAIQYNEAKLTFARDGGDDNLYFSVEITGGPDYKEGVTKDALYGTDWKTWWKVGGTDATAYTCGGGNQICIQGLGKNNSLTEVVIEAGTVFNTTNVSDANASYVKTPMRVTNRVRLAKNENGVWRAASDDVTVSFSNVNNGADNQLDQVYFNVMFTKGRYAEKTFGEIYNTNYTLWVAYTDWNDDGTEDVLSAWSLRGQIYVTGYNTTNADVKEIKLKAGTVFEPRTSGGVTPEPIRIANEIHVVKEDGVWNETPVDVEISFQNVDNAYNTSSSKYADNVYMSSDLTSQWSKGQTISDIYARNYTRWDLIQNDGSTVVVFSHNGRLLMQGWKSYDSDVTEIVIEAGTVLKPFAGSYPTGGTRPSPLRVTNTIKIVKNTTGESTWEWIDCYNTKMLNVLVQDNYDTAEVGASKFDMRFVGSINNTEDYQNAGFVFSTTNTNPVKGASGVAERTTTKLYTSILAAGEVKNVQDVYDTYSNHMFAYEIKNVPAGTTLYVRSFVTLTNGNVIYGNVKTITAPSAK